MQQHWADTRSTEHISRNISNNILPLLLLLFLLITTTLPLLLQDYDRLNERSSKTKQHLKPNCPDASIPFTCKTAQKSFARICQKECLVIVM